MKDFAQQHRLGVARWLQTQTQCTRRQIAEYLLLNEEQVAALEHVPEELSWSDSPIRYGHLTRRDIAFAEADPIRAIPVAPSGPHLAGKHDPRVALTPIQSNLRPFDHERIVRVGLCRLWFVQYGRNAWHSTWVTRYFTSGSVCLSKSLAQENAEGMRAQGSVFSIY